MAGGKRKGARRKEARLYSSEGASGPKGFYRSAREYFSASPSARIAGQWLREFVCGETREYHQAKTVEPVPHPYFTASVMCSPSYYAAVLKNARLWGEGGAVITEDNMLLADVSMEWGGDRVIVGEQHSVFERWEGEEPIPYAGIAAVLTFYASQNYYHWLFDVLPRIELIRISGLQPDKYIFNRPYLAPYQEETLEKLGIPQSQRCLTHQNFHMLAQTLIVPSVIMTAMYPYPQWACNFLRRSFLPAKIRSGEKKRLYISRANSERNIENEEEVLGLLAEYGFTKVLAETLSVARQADLFAHAEAIVAPHGAGLANLAFCSPGTTVIEFLSPNHVINYFWVLSNHVDADYYYLIGEAEAAEISSPYRVSLSKLQETLRLARL